MGASQSNNSVVEHNLTSVKIEPSSKAHALNPTMNPAKIKGLTRLFMEESRRKWDKDRDELDMHKVSDLFLISSQWCLL